MKKEIRLFQENGDRILLGFFEETKVTLPNVLNPQTINFIYDKFSRLTGFVTGDGRLYRYDTQNNPAYMGSFTIRQSLRVFFDYPIAANIELTEMAP